MLKRPLSAIFQGHWWWSSALEAVKLNWWENLKSSMQLQFFSQKTGFSHAEMKNIFLRASARSDLNLQQVFMFVYDRFG